MERFMTPDRGVEIHGTDEMGEPPKWVEPPPLAVIRIDDEYAPVGRSKKYRLSVEFPRGIDPEHLGKIQRIADAAKRAAEGEELMAEPRVFSEVRSIRAMIEGDYETPGILQRLADLRPEPEPHNFVGRRDRACRACGKTFDRGAHVIGVPAKGGRS